MNTTSAANKPPTWYWVVSSLAVLWMLLGAASIAAGEPEAELFTTRCFVSTSIWRARLLGDVVPELAP